jgi:DNA-binding IclR family transcriptional regulator
LQEELQRVRESGIAYDLEERSKGVCAVGVPLRDSTGEVIASIAVVVPPDRFGPAQKESISGFVREAGIAISGELGFR